MLIIAGVIFAAGYMKQKTNKDQELSVRYHYTTEGSSYDVRIRGTVMTYAHVDQEKIRERCAQWIQQAPCWTHEDIITEEARLTNQEMTDLKNLIGEAKILQLENYYGPELEVRCYPYVLQVNDKEITYCSRPDGPPKPEAFTRVTEKIQELVAQKFSK